MKTSKDVRLIEIKENGPYTIIKSGESFTLTSKIVGTFTVEFQNDKKVETPVLNEAIESILNNIKKQLVITENS